jgi:hypothetical protein
MGNSIEINNLTPIAGSVDVEVNGNLEGTFAAGSTIDVQITDGTNPVTPDDITVVGNTVTIEVPAGGGGAPVGATLMQTGQTTSYRTGDDANRSSEGRAVDFFTLASNNPFGNTNRFTDELGGQSYTNNIVIDWSTYDGATVLGWNRNQNSGPSDWNSAIDGALLVSIGTFTSGWRLPNIIEFTSVLNYSLNATFNYSPFNKNLFGVFWTSTTRAGATTQAFVCNLSPGNFTAQVKTTNQFSGWFAVRTFTVTGTTLT